MTSEEMLSIIKNEIPSLTMLTGEKMCDYTTLRLGGKADIIAEPSCTEELRLLVLCCSKNHIPMLVFGRGSNLLVLDGGIRGVAVHIGSKMSAIHCRKTSGGGCVECEAGLSMAAASKFAAENSLAGCEFMSGIPGSVGGGVLMNAGAYGGDMSMITEWVQVCGADGKMRTFTAKELDFAYRHTSLMGSGNIITSVCFKLNEGCKQDILDKMNELNRMRREKQPLDHPSCGSTFKRPVGGYAAQMIDECGLKGFCVGKARVSEKHAGFLINDGTSARDYLALIKKVQEKVQEKFGTRLECEVMIVGEDKQEESEK